MSLKFSYLISFVSVFLLFLLGCQKEVTEIIEQTSNEVFTPQSPVTNLIERTSLQDGSADNIIDGSSCSTLELPVTVLVNGEEIILNSKEDFNTVEHILDESNDDNDEIIIIFPVTVILADHSEVVLSNEQDLENLIDQCTENGDDDDIECVDFKFPLTISTYNADNQQSDVITITNDKDLYGFIHGLDENEYCSLNFPITVVLSGGDEMVINNNDELEHVLKDAINACDEDDDNDHNDDDIDDSNLVNIITEGNWAITYFFNEKDMTSDFADYLFTFYENGTVKAKKGDNTVEGKWSSDGDGGNLEIKLEFEESPAFHELNEDWKIGEMTEDSIELTRGGEDDDSASKLILERI